MTTYISTVTLDDVVSPALVDYNPVTRQRRYVDFPARLHLYAGGGYARLGIEFGGGVWHEFDKNTVDEALIHLCNVVYLDEPDGQLWEELRREWYDSVSLQAAFPYPDSSLRGLVYAIECAVLSHEGMFRHFVAIAYEGRSSRFAIDVSREIHHLVRLARLDRVRVHPRQFALYFDGKPATYVEVASRPDGQAVRNNLAPGVMLDEFDSLSVSCPPDADISAVKLWATDDSRRRVQNQFCAAVELHRMFPIGGAAMYGSYGA